MLEFYTMSVVKQWNWRHCFAVDPEGSPLIPVDGKQCREIFPGALDLYHRHIGLAIARSYCLFGGLVVFDMYGGIWSWVEETGHWVALSTDPES